MTRSLLLALPFALQALPSVHAWGTLGHTTVAYLAQNFVSPKTAKWAQAILNDTSDNYLANVATWADSYRYTAEGAFSAQLHYIDAMDNPPMSCSVDYERDCPASGCIVSALANYTQRVQSKKLAAVEIQKALKWIIHFTGDITQPLHDENLLIGGNLINVTFDSVATNLHASWDTKIPEKFIGGYDLAHAHSWAANLTTAIKTGQYKKTKTAWLSGLNVKKPVDTAMVWAKDGNSFTCTAVIPDGVSAVEGKEIGGAYADKTFPVVQQQIAKGGYRLAAWLNLIATGDAGLPLPARYTGYPRDAAVSVPDDVILSSEPNSAQLARRAADMMGCGCTEEEHHH